MVPPQYSPSDTTSARSPLAVVQSAPCQKRGFGKARYQVARKRGSARRLSSFCPLKQSFVFDFLIRNLGNPKIDASNQTARVCIVNSARFFILAIFGFPGVLPFPRDERSLNTPWFCLSNWFFANFNQAIDCKSIYADSWQPKNYASNRNGYIRITDAPLFVLLFFGTPGAALKCGKRRLVTTDFCLSC